jgi:DNA-binding response OmpR family regulator
MNELLRNKNTSTNSINNCQDKFIFIEESHELYFKWKKHQLTCKEFLILKTLVTNPLKPFSQKELNEISSGKDVYVSKRCIDTFISILRKKIGKDSIVSIRGMGYKINSIR